MIEITNLFTNCTISPRYSSKPEWIVWHYFGALSTAKECALWFCNPENNLESADFCIDDEDVIQVNPDIQKYYTWHCGGALQGVIRHSKFGICRNSNSIGIELRPYNDFGNVNEAVHAGWYFHKKTVDNAVELTKYLMKIYDIDADHVIMHADVTGKYCPAPFLDRPEEWEQVQKALGDEDAGTFGKEMVRVEIENLRIRKQPGLNSAIVDYIAPGVYTIVDKIQKDGYHWGKLLSGVGWIALEYTEKYDKEVV